MGLVKFALIGIDLLGWPVIALLYPLFASIRAVETGSRNHMRKLVIYWTIFSLFSLFEFAFVKVIEWMPFWSGVRLVVSFCLVMPQFEGSCLAYQGLVCLVIDRFGMLKKERHCKRDMFLDVLEKYIKENGSEALEKFIASEMTSPEARVENRHPETPPLKKSQEEWTCGLCNITTVGESQLNAHLQGSKHKSKLEFLKASLLDAKDTGPSSSRQVQRTRPKQPESPLFKKAQQEWTCDLCNITMKSKSMLNAHLQGSKHKSKLESPKASLIDEKDTALSPLHAQSVSSAWDLKGIYEAAEVKEIMPPKETVENWRPETPVLNKARQEWTCDLCKVTTMSEITFNGHLNGNKHKAKLESSLNESLLDSNDTGPSSPLQVQHARSVSAAWDVIATYAATEDKEIMPPQETAEQGLLEIPLVKRDQQEWTGDLCKVTADSESTLNGDLQGSKPKSKLEPTPEASLLIAKDTGSSHLVQHAQSDYAAWDLKGTYATAEVEELMPPKETAETRCPQTPLLKKAQPEWTCDLCKVTTTNEITFNGHLNGSRHKAKLESILKESLLEAKDTGPSPLVHHAQSVSAAWDVVATYAATEDKEIMPPQETAEQGLLEIPLVKRDQQEWTGDLCKVTADSESTLNGDLQGSKPKSKLEPTPEASLLIAKDTGSSPLVQHAQSDYAAWDLKGTYATAEVEELMLPKETAETRCPQTPLLKKAQPEWTCDLCKVTTTNEITFNGHLNGRRHKAKLESILKESLLEAKDTGPSPLVHHAESVSAAWDLNGTYAFAENKEIMPPKETAEKRLPETPLLKKSTQEWTGDLCKVTAESESTLNDDPHGSKQKSMVEPTLETSLLDEKVTGPSPLVQLAQSVSVAGDLNGTYPAAEDKDIMPPQEAAEERRPGSHHKSKVETTLKASLLQQDTGPSPLVQHPRSVYAAWDLKGTYVATDVDETILPKEIAEKRHPETHLLKKSQPEWTCDLCKVTTTSEITLNAHLHGSKHKAKYEASLQESFLELEKIIASQTGQGDCSLPYRDVQEVESVGKNGSAAPQQVQYAQSIEVPKEQMPRLKRQRRHQKQVVQKLIP